MTEPMFQTAENRPISDSAVLSDVMRHLRFARAYTLSLLDGLADDQWFEQPTGGVTHIAWQVGHIAMAQYGLALFRQRGRAEIDLELMPSSFRKKFSRGTTPDPNPETNPSPAEIRSTLDRIFEQVEKELPQFELDTLNQPVDPPYAAFSTNFGALLFAVDHEMIHAGQIGLIRRLLGLQPVR